MPVHDWTRVDAGIFHDFHVVWTVFLRNALNEGLLPKGYYALAEQHAGRAIADVLTLHGSPEPQGPAWPPPDTGGIAVAESPPRVLRRQTVEPSPLGRRRSLAIRHVSGQRLIALIEIISPANKDRARHVEDFVNKAVSALEHGVHLLLIDLFPPGLHDPSSIHGAITQSLDEDGDPYVLPPGKPLTLASYVAGSIVEIYLEHLAVGMPLAEMPLFSGTIDTSTFRSNPLTRRRTEACPNFIVIFSKVERLRCVDLSELTTTRPRPRQTLRLRNLRPRTRLTTSRSPRRLGRCHYPIDRGIDGSDWFMDETERSMSFTKRIVVVIRRVDRLVPIGRLGVKARERLGPAVRQAEDDGEREQPLKDPAAILRLDVLDLGAADVLLQPGDLLPGDPALLSLARHDPAGDHDDDCRQHAARSPVAR